MHSDRASFGLKAAAIGGLFLGQLQIVSTELESSKGKLEKATAKGKELGDAQFWHSVLRQCLLNLASNACKFTDHGTVSVAVSRETIDGQDWMTFGVSDTGIGMTPAVTQRLFTTFTQADETITRRFGGSGLGLAITARAAEAMNAKFTLTNQQAGGLCATLIWELR